MFMAYIYIACVVGNVSDRANYIVPGSVEHRELWMIRLREVILLLLAMLSVLVAYTQRSCHPTSAVYSFWLSQLPRVWSNNLNKLPQDQFKHSLKRWLFECIWQEARLIDVN